ncbi:flagellar hook-basal body complex protein FliE [Celerinatantimonas yamalensis]|uniref:Flagellar hook-basal body complex protein FliE n=1 Tax=Celerinatantimonas yamalensis TaxID=559956 RepID=A0ABW9G604_9GAMM
MKLDAAPLIQQMNSMSQQASGLSPQQAIQADKIGISPAQGASQGNAASGNFGQLLSDAINHVNSLQGQTNDLRTQFDLGDKNVSLSDVMIAAQKSSIALDATIEVRNKVVEAYKQVMAMPI